MCADFLPPCAPHFDGRATVRCLVKHRNPRIAALFAMKMQRVRRIAAHLAKSATVPNRVPSHTKSIGNHISVVHCLIKNRCINFTNCCFIFDVRIPYIHVRIMRTLVSSEVHSPVPS